MRYIEVKSQPYCTGCPMESLSIIAASAVCDHAMMCDRLFQWIKDGKKYLGDGSAAGTYADDGEVKHKDIEDLI